MFRFECQEDRGGFGFTGKAGDILAEVRMEYGFTLLAKVKAWIAGNSKTFQTKSFTIYRL